MSHSMFHAQKVQLNDGTCSVNKGNVLCRSTDMQYFKSISVW